PHDVPDRHVHVDLRAVRGPELHLPLRDFRAQSRDVAVVELVLDEPSDQGRLADRGLADEADFRLDSLGLGHRGHRPIRLRLLKGSAGRTSWRNLFVCAPLRDRDAPRPAIDPRPRPRRSGGGSLGCESGPPGARCDQGGEVARVAVRAGAAGIVAPATRPERLKALRAIIGSRLILSPGVGAQGGNAREAIAAGADAVIVGRAIYEAADPIAAAQGVANEIRS